MSLPRLLLAGLAGALCCAGLFAATAAAAESKTGASGLEREKIEAEIEKLEAESDQASGARGVFSAIAAPLTGLAAIATIIVSLIGFGRERERQRMQLGADRRAKLEDRFASLLLGLGEKSEAVQAGAAVSLLSFLGPESTQFHQQVRWAAIANLRIEHPTTVRALLLRVFEDSMRTEVAVNPRELDLSHAFLAEAKLEGLELSGADLQEADLHRAALCNSTLVGVRGERVRLEKARLSGAGTDLRNARLPRARAAGASFGGANLVNSHFEGADLREVSFRGARMQAAHFEDAKLQGASFEGANLADTYFLGASFDTRSIASVLKAENWAKAHFEPSALAELEDRSVD